jgi:hypothetical protein
VLADMCDNTNYKNVTQYEAEMNIKYNIFIYRYKIYVECESMTVPALSGDTGIATKIIKKILEAILRKYSTDSQQNTLILGHHPLYGKYWSLKLKA